MFSFDDSVKILGITYEADEDNPSTVADYGSTIRKEKADTDLQNNEMTIKMLDPRFLSAAYEKCGILQNIKETVTSMYQSTLKNTVGGANSTAREHAPSDLDIINHLHKAQVIGERKSRTEQVVTSQKSYEKCKDTRQMKPHKRRHKHINNRSESQSDSFSKISELSVEVEDSRKSRSLCRNKVSNTRIALSEKLKEDVLKWKGEIETLEVKRQIVSTMAEKSRCRSKEKPSKAVKNLADQLQPLNIVDVCTQQTNIEDTKNRHNICSNMELIKSNKRSKSDDKTRRIPSTTRDRKNKNTSKESRLLDNAIVKIPQVEDSATNYLNENEFCFDSPFKAYKPSKRMRNNSPTQLNVIEDDLIKTPVLKLSDVLKTSNSESSTIDNKLVAKEKRTKTDKKSHIPDPNADRELCIDAVKMIENGEKIIDIMKNIHVPTKSSEDIVKVKVSKKHKIKLNETKLSKSCERLQKQKNKMLRKTAKCNKTYKEPIDVKNEHENKNYNTKIANNDANAPLLFGIDYLVNRQELQDNTRKQVKGQNRNLNVVISSTDEEIKIDRREISFCNLNLSPIIDNYAKNKSIIEDVFEAKKIALITKSRRINNDSPRSRKSDEFSIISEVITTKERALRRHRQDRAKHYFGSQAKDTRLINQTMNHLVSNQNLVEVSTKMIANDLIKLTVEGIEPPRKLSLTCSKRSSSISRNSSLHMTFLEPVICGFTNQLRSPQPYSKILNTSIEESVKHLNPNVMSMDSLMSANNKSNRIDESVFPNIVRDEVISDTNATKCRPTYERKSKITVLYGHRTNSARRKELRNKVLIKGNKCNANKLSHMTKHDDSKKINAKSDLNIKKSSTVTTKKKCLKCHGTKIERNATKPNDNISTKSKPIAQKIHTQQIDKSVTADISIQCDVTQPKLYNKLKTTKMANADTQTDLIDYIKEPAADNNVTKEQIQESKIVDQNCVPKTAKQKIKNSVDMQRSPVSIIPGVHKSDTDIHKSERKENFNSKPSKPFTYQKLQSTVMSLFESGKKDAFPHRIDLPATNDGCKENAYLSTNSTTVFSANNITAQSINKSKIKEDTVKTLTNKQINQVCKHMPSTKIFDTPEQTTTERSKCNITSNSKRSECCKKDHRFNIETKNNSCKKTTKAEGPTENEKNVSEVPKVPTKQDYSTCLSECCKKDHRFNIETKNNSCKKTSKAEGPTENEKNVSEVPKVPTKQDSSNLNTTDCKSLQNCIERLISVLINFQENSSDMNVKTKDLIVQNVEALETYAVTTVQTAMPNPKHVMKNMDYSGLDEKHYVNCKPTESCTTTTKEYNHNKLILERRLKRSRSRPPYQQISDQSNTSLDSRKRLKATRKSNFKHAIHTKKSRLSIHRKSKSHKKLRSVFKNKNCLSSDSNTALSSESGYIHLANDNDFRSITDLLYRDSHDHSGFKKLNHKEHVCIKSKVNTPISIKKSDLSLTKCQNQSYDVDDMDNSSDLIGESPSSFISNVERKLNTEAALHQVSKELESNAAKKPIPQQNTCDVLDQLVYMFTKSPNGCNLTNTGGMSALETQHGLSQNTNRNSNSSNNFSCDSLDNSYISQSQKNTYNLPPKQCNFFVYSNTIELDRDMKKNLKKSENKQFTTFANNNANSRDILQNAYQSTSTVGQTSSTDNSASLNNVLSHDSGYASGKKSASLKDFFKKGSSLLDLFKHSKTNTRSTACSSLKSRTLSETTSQNDLSTAPSTSLVTESSEISSENSLASGLTIPSYWFTICPEKKNSLQTVHEGVQTTPPTKEQATMQTWKDQSGTNQASQVTTRKKCKEGSNNKLCFGNDIKCSQDRCMKTFNEFATSIPEESHIQYVNKDGDQDHVIEKGSSLPCPSKCRDNYVENNYKQNADIKDIPPETLVGKKPFRGCRCNKEKLEDTSNEMYPKLPIVGDPQQTTNKSDHRSSFTLKAEDSIINLVKSDDSTDLQVVKEDSIVRSKGDQQMPDLNESVEIVNFILNSIFDDVMEKVKRNYVENEDKISKFFEAQNFISMEDEIPDEAEINIESPNTHTSLNEEAIIEIQKKSQTQLENALTSKRSAKFEERLSVDTDKILDSIVLNRENTLDATNKGIRSRRSDKSFTVMKEVEIKSRNTAELTDKEIFDKMLEAYEKEDIIADRVSRNDELFDKEMESIKSASPSKKSVSEIGSDDAIKKPPGTLTDIKDDKKVKKKKGKFAKLFHRKEAVKDIMLTPEEDSSSLKQKNELEPALEARSRRNSMMDTSNVKLSQRQKDMRFGEDNRPQTKRITDCSAVEADDIGACFARGFRPDNLALSGDACFNFNKQDKLHLNSNTLSSEESIIDFSERQTPLDYLLALGFMVDEASNALKDEDIRSRLLAAITEARVWINRITTTQGTLLYLVAYKTNPKIMRYFLQLVEAIINKRINNAIKLNGFLKVLEKVEDGELQMINLLGADKFEDEENEEKIVKKQLRQLFATVYKIADKEVKLQNKILTKDAILLLRVLAAKYRTGLHPHLELIARYIGQNLIKDEIQLEAAMIYLSRLDTANVKLKEFEAYCAIRCDENEVKKEAK